MFMHAIYCKLIAGLLLLGGIATGSFASNVDASMELLKEGRYIIRFKNYDQGLTQLPTAPGAVLVHFVFPDLNAIAATLSRDALAAMKSNLNVDLIEPDYPRYALNQRVPYGIRMVQADRVPDDLTNNRKVCVIDSGYSLGHPDLPSSPAIVGGDGVPSNLDWRVDACHHGTHVTGTIAALNNEEGVIGVAPSGRLRLHIVRALDGNPTACSGFVSAILAAVQRCREAGSHVINMSLGGPSQSQVERASFDATYRAGVLTIAAAGNGGNAQCSYPACYDSVVSVAAINENKERGNFSTFNADVELAAPGLRVDSTVPVTQIGETTVDSQLYANGYIVDSAQSTGVTAELVSGDALEDPLCERTHPEWDGKVVLCRRGIIPFSEKTLNVQRSGGVAVVIYNNIEEGRDCARFTINGVPVKIPAVKLTLQDGEYLRDNRLGYPATVVSLNIPNAPNYSDNCGTSMASPHVAGVAALIWSYNPAWTNVQIRDALTRTAEDLGPVGRDPEYGFGLIRAQNALNHLLGGGPVPGASGAPSKSAIAIDRHSHHAGDTLVTEACELVTE